MDRSNFLIFLKLLKGLIRMNLLMNVMLILEESLLSLLDDIHCLLVALADGENAFEYLEKLGVASLG
jgi:hypothetical protein